MKTSYDCIPCFVRQTLDTAKILNLDEKITGELIRKVLGVLQRELDWSLPPPVLAVDIHREIRGILGNSDPYLRRKISDTEAALLLLPKVEAAIADSNDPFFTAVQFSIAGNAIDLGTAAAVHADVNKSFLGAMTSSVDRQAVTRLKQAILAAKQVLFLADNAGEIVFDRPLIEMIGREKVVVAVRGGPIINDATFVDAERSGLTERFRVVSNGCDMPGTWLSKCSKEFVDIFKSADLIVAKGQGNYESMNEYAKNTFFLFLAKCAVVAKELGVPERTCLILEAN